MLDSIHRSLLVGVYLNLTLANELSHHGWINNFSYSHVATWPRLLNFEIVTPHFLAYLV